MSKQRPAMALQAVDLPVGLDGNFIGFLSFSSGVLALIEFDGTNKKDLTSFGRKSLQLLREY